MNCVFRNARDSLLWTMNRTRVSSPKWRNLCYQVRDKIFWKNAAAGEDNDERECRLRIWDRKYLHLIRELKSALWISSSEIPFEKWSYSRVTQILHFEQSIEYFHSKLKSESHVLQRFTRTNLLYWIFTCFYKFSEIQIEPNSHSRFKKLFTVCNL